MTDSGTGFGQVPRFQACGHGAHGDCAHFVTTGGGFNPRRLRLEFGAALCPCTCHSSCPVTPTGKRWTVPVSAWRESCICPGAEQERRRLDEAGIEFPDFGEMYHESRRRSRASKEAFDAARARAAGKSRDEIREIYVAELNARALRVPRDDILDVVVERIAGNPLPAARLAAQTVVQMGRALNDLYRVFHPRS